MSIRDELLSLIAKKKPLAPVKFYGKDLFVREMTSEERDAFSNAQFDAEKTGDALKNFSAKLVARVLVEAGGDRVFRDDDPSLLSNASPIEVQRVYNLAIKLNALGADDVKALEKK